MNVSYILLAGCLTLTALTAYPQDQNKSHFAVTSIRAGKGVKEDEASLLADRLRVELFKTRKVVMMEREQMNEILSEQGFQQSGACTDEECLVKMGQMLGVEYLVSGSIGRLGSLLMCNFRVISVVSGKVTQVVSRDISGGIEGVVNELKSVAFELVGEKRTADALKKNVPKPVVKKAVDTQPESGGEPEGEAVLEINTYPEDAEIFVDNESRGTGDMKLTLSAGIHKIYAQKDGKKTDVETVSLQEGAVEDIRVRLERPVRFSLATDFSLMLGRAKEIGPSLLLGLKIKNHFVGLNYFWGVEYIDLDSDYYSDGRDMGENYDKYAYLFGGGFLYHYVFNLANVLLVSPGVTVGFWYEEIGFEYYDYNYNYDYDNSDKHEDFYFGGPRVRLQIGYKYVYLNFDATLLIGSGGIKPLLNPGIAAYF
jgi:TolB-like protein